MNDNDLSYLDGTMQANSAGYDEGWEAHARLVAAAPEMHEELKAAARELRMAPGGSRVANRIDDLLDRIRGAEVTA